MPQISLYIDEKTLKKVENAAHKEHLSLSKWVVEQIKSKIEPVYPKDYGTLFGSINDDTFKRPKEIDSLNDSKRESL